MFLQGSTHKDIYGRQYIKSELMGISPLEAMSCGCFSILANTGSFKEIIPDSRCGIIFDDKEELKTILEKPVANENLDIMYRHETIKNNFGLIAVGKKLINVYERVLNAHTNS